MELTASQASIFCSIRVFICTFRAICLSACKLPEGFKTGRVDKSVDGFVERTAEPVGIVEAGDGMIFPRSVEADFLPSFGYFLSGRTSTI